MRVLVVGASGLIGGYVTSRLLADGREIIGASRNIATGRRRWPSVAWIEADIGRMTAGDWRGHLMSVDAVVNCAGALQDGPADDLTAVHLTGVVALAEACVHSGVRRFVQVSALGVDKNPGAFAHTKQAADQALSQMDLDWIIIRPGLVLAPAAYGGSALLRGLAAFPLAIPAVHADRVVQAVSVDDLADCIARAIRPETPSRLVATLSGLRRTTLAEGLCALRAWLGLPSSTVISIPPTVGALAGRVADGLAWLGWKSALRSAALGQLAAGVEGETDAGARQLGFVPRDLSDILAAWPSTVQDRWFSRLYFLKPLLLATLIVFWIATGLIGFTSLGAATAVLARAGFEPALARATVQGGALVDIALGLMVCFRRTACLGLLGMILATFAYLAGGSLWSPELWADPLGPMLKPIPAAVLALVAMATLDDR